MSSLSNSVYSFTRSLHPGPYGSHFTMIDDILGLVVVSGFSVIQAQFLSRLRRHNKGKTTKSWTIADYVFRETHTLLAAGYMICAILTLASFAMKSGLVGQRTIPVDYTARCPELYERFDYFMDVCLEQKWHTLLDITIVFDYILGGLFQVLLLLADGLMIYRCYKSVKRPWSHLFVTMGALRVFAFILLAPMSLAVCLIPIYVSFLVTLITCVTLVIVTAFTDQSSLELNDLRTSGNDALAHENVPYRRFIGIVVKSAIPMTLAGALHIGLFAGLQIIPVAVNALLFSFTVLAPQKIALQVLEHAGRDLLDGPSSEQPISLPISPSDADRAVIHQSTDDHKLVAV
ncbi:hypothetical protein BKA70DRAFT_1568441 [Coprinopsis sp. MPI-PUGE-AT-0042]|nr:hypothetical protein BKA70DRAFT_1568441 [Coprinopsis sp. MPI-PUGE-AT-0042]